MAIYRGDTKVSGVGKGFRPENPGTEGQVLTKTATGYAFEDIPEVTIDSALSTTSENPVQNKVITNAIQNAGGSSDHLEIKAPVGELYKLTDTMFLQNTPTLADSTVEQKVGDVAANTQIHIQRIASGTGSNELKLKVKKVGTPGDLSVQVMKGVQVTVTANVEAYWYGDSNNVLASGTVSASSITTSWQEITVTLDNKVGGTEGELLDIVLSIPTVNASNYVIIACDSTQWSEGFSLVAVNGSTRTRSKLMPYCISNAFTNDMLVKVSGDTVAFNDNTRIFSWSGQVGPVNSATTVKTKIGEITIPLKNSLKITYNTSGDDGQYKFVYLNDVMIHRVDGSGSYNVTVDKDANTYEVFAGGQSFSNRARALVTSVVIDRTKIYIGKTGIGGNPSSVKSIGERLAILIFGINKDTFYLGEEVSSVSSGTIAPSNFVGYIKIGKYKIPYYV